jgi:hypothetical protein
MAAQPANTDILVFRNMRSYRQAHRHESVAALIKRLRPLVMSIPSEEIQVEVLSRDTGTADFSSYMGEARHTASRGFPIVVGLKDTVSFETAQESLPDVDFAYQIGGDMFITNTEAGLSGDLFGDAKSL